MKMFKSPPTLFICFLLVWGVEAIYLSMQNDATVLRVEDEEISKRQLQQRRHLNKIRELGDEHDRNKHLATGETVLDRIYNTQNQTIIELIQRISQEVLPGSWSSDVKAEEFTNFILLITLPPQSQQLSAIKIVPYLYPIISYCGDLLTDVAVFDSAHKSYLLFDASMLNEIAERGGELSEELLSRAESQGQAMTRFNSITIQCKKQDSHLYVPIEVKGRGGIVQEWALLDTGASTTTLGEDIVTEAYQSDFSKAPVRYFETANGPMSCPIITMEVNVGGVRKSIEVAVNAQSDMNLLGVNFFDGMNYIVDFRNSSIYMWVE
jgi:predicted aspartyl protease